VVCEIVGIGTVKNEGNPLGRGQVGEFLEQLGLAVKAAFRRVLHELLVIQFPV
jgi:hypothetical protein